MNLYIFMKPIFPVNKNFLKEVSLRKRWKPERSLLQSGLSFKMPRTFFFPNISSRFKALLNRYFWSKQNKNNKRIWGQAFLIFLLKIKSCRNFGGISYINFNLPFFIGGWAYSEELYGCSFLSNWINSLIDSKFIQVLNKLRLLRNRGN